jgi:hypothetical protein
MRAFPRLAVHGRYWTTGPERSRRYDSAARSRKLARLRALMARLKATMKHGTLAGYVTPAVTDYGTLVEMTTAAHLIMGAAGIHDLSFSSPNGGGGPIGGGSNPPGPGEPVAPSAGTISDLTDGPGGSPGTANGGADPGGGVLSSGGTSAGGTSSGGASGGGGKLPFTGLEAGVVGAIGSALAAGGTALRRAVRRRGR